MLNDKVAEIIKYMVGGNLQRERFLKIHFDFAGDQQPFFFFFLMVVALKCPFPMTS